jgi:hypothetical protein
MFIKRSNKTNSINITITPVPHLNTMLIKEKYTHILKGTERKAYVRE